MADIHADCCCIIRSSTEGQILIFTKELPIICPGNCNECPEVGVKMTVFPNNTIPLEAQYLYRQSLDLSMEGKKEEALASLKKVVFIAPRFCNAYNAMGNCLDELGQYEEAVKKYEKVLDIDPHHAEAQFKRDLVIKKRQGEVMR